MILAIDPGPKKSAFVVWDGECVIHHGIEPNENLFDVACDCSGSFDHCAIEMIASYGMPVGAEVFESCVWIGRFMELWARVNPTSPIRIPRKEICVHLCGSARAKDANIRAALIDRIGKPGTKREPGPTYGIKADEWQALAVAVTVFDRLKCGIKEVA